jgi:haloalkane dehalogenase
MSQDQPSADSPEMGATTAEQRTDGQPRWLDRTEYPFESNYLDLEPGRLHYVDEGEGRPILMLHGNLTWSFLYRKVIRDLSDEHRCIAPDYFGFGLSDKPRYWSYRPADHARMIEAFVEELGLDDVTLVVQDWGGPIGLSYAERHPDDVHSLVICNSWCWPIENRLRARTVSTLLGGPVGRYFGKRYNFFADRLLPMGFADRSRLTDAVKRHYTEPLANPEDRKGTWTFARELTGSSAWLEDLWEMRAAVAGEQALLCWGMQGSMFGADALRTWQGLYPDARTAEFDDAGHFLPEEKGPELAAEIRRFLSES